MIYQLCNFEFKDELDGEKGTICPSIGSQRLRGTTGHVLGLQAFRPPVQPRLSGYERGMTDIEPQ
jgi:hypothetical protein